MLRFITRLVLLLVLGVLAPGEAVALTSVRVWPPAASAEKLASWGCDPETAVLRQAATMQAAETQQAASSLGYDFASGRLLAAENASNLIPLKNNSVRQLLESRGVAPQSARNVVNSFDGQIYVSRGSAGAPFVVTESASGAASGIFVTRGSAGATPALRVQNLALPPGNTAAVETSVRLTQPQWLIEGRVGPQLKWGPDRTGGGWQVITNGGRRDGAIE